MNENKKLSQMSAEESTQYIKCVLNDFAKDVADGKINVIKVDLRNGGKSKFPDILQNANKRLRNIPEIKKS